MITFTFGCTLSTVCVSANALSRSPSLGWMATSVIFGYFWASRSLMYLIHSFWLAALRLAVMMANSPLPPMMRAASSVSV